MIDRRSEILVRIEGILNEAGAALSTPVPVGRVFRNRGEVPPTLRPAMVLLDGLEETTLTKKSPRGGPSSSLMVLKPQIFALLHEKTKGKSDDYADVINEYRNVIITRILYDTPLLGIMGDNGGIIYNGFETDMQTGSTMHGELQFYFVFHYPLIPSELL